MSAEFAITWALICVASMYATYRAGIAEERGRWMRRREKHRRWREWMDEGNEE